MDNAVFRRCPEHFPPCIGKTDRYNPASLRAAGVIPVFLTGILCKAKQQSPLWKGLDESHESS